MFDNCLKMLCDKFLVFPGDRFSREGVGSQKVMLAFPVSCYLIDKQTQLEDVKVVRNPSTKHARRDFVMQPLTVVKERVKTQRVKTDKTNSGYKNVKTIEHVEQPESLYVYVPMIEELKPDGTKSGRIEFNRTYLDFIFALRHAIEEKYINKIMGKYGVEDQDDLTREQKNEIHAEMEAFIKSFDGVNFKNLNLWHGMKMPGYDPDVEYEVISAQFYALDKNVPTYEADKAFLAKEVRALKKRTTQKEPAEKMLKEIKKAIGRND